MDSLFCFYKEIVHLQIRDFIYNRYGILSDSRHRHLLDSRQEFYRTAVNYFMGQFIHILLVSIHEILVYFILLHRHGILTDNYLDILIQIFMNLIFVL